MVERMKSLVKHLVLFLPMPKRLKPWWAEFQAVTFGSIVVFDLSYQRDVDKKSYRVSRPAWLYKDGNTGKPRLIVPVISSEYKHFFDELASGGGTSR